MNRAWVDNLDTKQKRMEKVTENVSIQQNSKRKIHRVKYNNE